MLGLALQNLQPAVAPRVKEDAFSPLLQSPRTSEDKTSILAAAAILENSTELDALVAARPSTERLNSHLYHMMRPVGSCQ